MKKLWQENGLSITLLTLFILFLLGQMFSGFAAYNVEQELHGQAAVALGAYFASGHFWEALFENLESEFLQMGAFVILTVFLAQKGSSQSNDPDEPEQPEPDPGKPGAPGPVRSGGWRLGLYKHSLSLLMLTLFLLTWLLHGVFGLKDFNEELSEAGRQPVGLWAYLLSSRFWFESFQNWQSEFLAIFTIVVATIHLREHKSPESKPVDAPHSQTGP